MISIFTRGKKELERLQRAYAECYSENAKLKDRITELKEHEEALTETINGITNHITALALINGALMEVATEDQKKEARKIVLKKEKGTKKGKKNVKVKKG